MPLRPSQVETLRLLKWSASSGLRSDHLAKALGISEGAVKLRLARLRRDPRRPFVEIVLCGYWNGPRFKLYRLTQLGQEALDESRKRGEG